MQTVIEETYSYFKHKMFLSEFTIDEQGKFICNGPFRDVCEVIGDEH